MLETVYWDAPGDLPAAPADLRLPARVDRVRATCTDDVGAAALLIRPDGYLCRATDNSPACGTTLLSTIANDLTELQ